MIRPGLSFDPLKRVKAIGSIVTVSMVFALGTITSAAILIHGGVATPHDLAPAPQNSAKQRSTRVRKPALCAVCDVLALRHRDAIRDAVQDHREARAALLRQIDKRIQAYPIAHRDHRLKTSRSVDRLHHVIFASRSGMFGICKQLVAIDFAWLDAQSDSRQCRNSDARGGLIALS